MADPSAEASFDYLFKAIVVGDGAVGKTAITVRYATNKFQQNYKMTIGVDLIIKMVDVKDKQIKCQIWDTGGQERFSKIRPLYYRGALGGLVVYDVTNRESFDNLERWFGEIKKNCGEIPIILIGNKIDLENRVVTRKQAKTYAEKKSKEFGYEISYLETSAKTGQSINKVFSNLINMMVDNVEIADKEKEKAKKKK